MSKTKIAFKKPTSVVQNTTPIGYSVDHDIRIAVDGGLNTIISELSKAKTAIDKKYMELGGTPGLPVNGVEYGAGDGYKRRYQNGVIYFLPPAGPCLVKGAILNEYLSLGAEAGFLGYPTTDERSTPDGAGRYNHFERGSIYWTYGTGAHEIHGAIRDKWASLGWEKSWLGFPASGEKAFTEDGRVSQFQYGFIYWWPDIGAFDLGAVTLRYKGLYCFGETDEFSSADEPYVVLGMVPVPESVGANQGTQLRTQIYDDVDSGDSRPDDLELYRGNPHGIIIGIALCEHDEGDPNKYLGLVKSAVDLVGKGVAAGCGALFGAEAAPTCESIWKEMGPLIVSTVNDLAGTEDDLIGKAPLQITAKDMVTLARQPRGNFWGIQYHRESELLSDGDASYKVYFAIEPA